MSGFLLQYYKCENGNYDIRIQEVGLQALNVHNRNNMLAYKIMNAIARLDLSNA